MKRWTVAIFSSREQLNTLEATVDAAIVAAHGQDALIEVIINGNPGLAEAIAASLRAPSRATAPGVALRVWDIPLGDKAHAWNCYLYDIWRDSELAFFIDGYAAVRPDALILIADGLANTPGALAGTGVPTVGRSAKAVRETMLREGGAHGNLYVLRGETMRRFRDAGFRLPLGIYRTDPLLTSAMCFNLDPANNKWDWKRVYVHPTATWTFRPLAWYRPADLLIHFRRTLRQMQGDLETRAFGEHLAVRRQRPEALPPTSAEMVSVWLRADPVRTRRMLLRNPLLLLGVRRLSQPRDWSGTRLPPRLVGTIGTVAA